MISGLYSLPLSPVADLPAASLRASQGNTSPKSAVAHRAFVAGEENALVRSLARAAIEKSPPCNPLVVCGGGGVGKTSVALALAALRREKLGLKQVVNTTGSDLFRGLANAIDSDAAGDFRSRYHRCDLLVIDEVHRLAGKAAAQQFLVTALDALLQRGVLVIASMPRLPQDTDGLLPTLASRLASGLIVTLHPPGPAARRELVREAAEQIDLPLSEDAIARLAASGDGALAGSLLTAPRLRHAVLQLAARAGGPSRTKPDHVSAQAIDPKLAFRETTVVVGRHFGLTMADLKGKSRQQHIADARALAMYLARRLTGASYSQLGRFFGGRDHSTVLHACQKTEGLLQSDDALRRLSEDLFAQISAVPLSSDLAS